MLVRGPYVLRGFAAQASSESDSKRFMFDQALARRRERSRRLASSTQAVALATVASKSLARRRLRPNQAKLRSTTHRRGGSWKRFVPGGGFTTLWVSAP